MRTRFEGLLAAALIAVGAPSTAWGASLGIPVLRLELTERAPGASASAAAPALLARAEDDRPYAEPPPSAAPSAAPAPPRAAEPPPSIERFIPAAPPASAEPPPSREASGSAAPSASPEPPAASGASRAGPSAAPLEAPRSDPTLRVTPGRAARAFGLAAAGVAANDAIAALMLALGYLGPEGEAMTTGAGLALLGPGVVASSVTDTVLQRRGRARSWPVYAANVAAAAAALLVATGRDLSGRQGVAVFLGIQLVVVPATAVAWSASSPQEKAGD